LCRHLSHNSFFVVQIETHGPFLLSSHNTTGTFLPHLRRPEPEAMPTISGSKKSCSGTPSAQVDFAIKSYYGTPAVFDDPMQAAIAACIGPKFF